MRRRLAVLLAITCVAFFAVVAAASAGLNIGNIFKCPDGPACSSKVVGEGQPGTEVTVTGAELKAQCKEASYPNAAFDNQGSCVGTVEKYFKDGITLTVPFPDPTD